MASCPDYALWTHPNRIRFEETHPERVLRAISPGGDYNRPCERVTTPALKQSREYWLRLQAIPNGTLLLHLSGMLRLRHYSIRRSRYDRYNTSLRPKARVSRKDGLADLPPTSTATATSSMAFACTKELALNLQYETIVSLPFEENSYVVFLSGQRECIVVDPGLEPDLIIQYLQRQHLSPVAIFNTHGHSDHIAGNQALKDFAPNADLLIGHADADKLTDPVKNLSAAFGIRLFSPPADQVVSHGDQIAFAGIHWTIRETPGHSIGHVIFLCQDCSPWLVLGGDVLFQGSIGRSDFPDGNHEALLHSIRTQLYDLPDTTLVLPGHGNVTTIGAEKRNNPFVRGVV